MKVKLPNVRKTFIPDPGYTMFDCDLSGADAQVVAWEAEDEDLKAAFRAGLDVHSKNAEDMFGSKFTRITDKQERYKFRQKNKQAVHLTNYGGTPRAIGMVLGWTTHESENFQRRWFELHPGIKKNFQEKIQNEINTTRSVRNIYGFRRIYFDRPEDCYTEALAWKPQSTVALVTYLGALQLEARYPQVETLLQNHDSLVFQIPNIRPVPREQILDALRVVTPYPDPLTIPWGISKSEVSWGDCEEWQ